MSTVMALSKAATTNKIYDSITFTNGVAVGAVHAIEAGFSGKTPKALKRYQDALMRQVRQAQSKNNGETQDAAALLGGFAGVMRQEKHGRRKNKSRSHP